MTLHIEKLNGNMDGLSSTAYSWTASKPVGIEYKATWDEKHRCTNQYVLRWKDEKNTGKMSIQDDFRKAARSLAAVRH